MGDIQKRLDNVRQMIQSQDFLEGKGLSNEVNIRIFCYEPRDEMAVRHFIEQLSTDLTLECQLRICNLYQIFLGICEGMDILDAIPDMEEEAAGAATVAVRLRFRCKSLFEILRLRSL